MSGYVASITIPLMVAIAAIPIVMTRLARHFAATAPPPSWL